MDFLSAEEEVVVDLGLQELAFCVLYPVVEKEV